MTPPLVRRQAAGVQPETRYAKSKDARVAYQVLGDGPLELVFIPNWVSIIDVRQDETPEQAGKIVCDLDDGVILCHTEGVGDNSTPRRRKHGEDEGYGGPPSTTWTEC